MCKGFFLAEALITRLVVITLQSIVTESTAQSRAFCYPEINGDQQAPLFI